MRRIFVPTMELQSALRWIHDHILSVLQPHPRAFAYRAKTTVVDCASEHCGARWLVKFDAQDFFESIDEGQIFRVFRACGYPALLAFELARLTTVPVDFLTSRRDTIHIQSDIESACSAEGAVHVIQEYDFHERGVLGQGLVTSPALSNLVCRELDASLQKTANELGFVFTRYADDITFSTTRRQLTTLDVGTLRKRVLSVLRRNNLRENRKKFSVTGPGARRVVLGLLVDGEKPRLSRATRARIEGHLYFLTKLGANLHAARRKFRSIDALQQHLIGLLAYVKQVDGNLHATYEKLAKNIAWPPE
jgi:RNA-directed DNA polymerase